ncbi:MAG: hypothetical protein Q8P26_01225 [Candidatus Levybacteria bacterium]|nr:hypothetical protein [Candidatus Levybacteria bacterium]
MSKRVETLSRVFEPGNRFYRAVQINWMPGQWFVSIMKKYLDDFLDIGATGDATNVRVMINGSILVSRAMEDERGEVVLSYALFNSSRQLLPDLYACGKLAGNYQKAEELLERVLDSQGGIKGKICRSKK